MGTTSELSERLAARAWWKTPLWLVLAAVLIVPGDVFIARSREGEAAPKFLGELLDKLEPFGHAIGVALIAATIAVLDPGRRRYGPAVCLTGAFAGGLSADIIKLLVARTRPRDFDMATGTVAETFRGWFPLGTGGSALQSFPSAHTATAVGLALGLSVLYPRGRWWFFTLAALVGCHRIDSSAHYPSDVFVGAAVGLIAGQGALRLLARWLTPRGVEQNDRPRLRVVA